MRDGAAERAARRALGVHVDPLVVVGRVGEGVNPVLLHPAPRRRTKVQLDDVRELGHGQFDRHTISATPS